MDVTADGIDMVCIACSCPVSDGFCGEEAVAECKHAQAMRSKNAGDFSEKIEGFREVVDTQSTQDDVEGTIRVR